MKKSPDNFNSSNGRDQTESKSVSHERTPKHQDVFKEEPPKEETIERLEELKGERFMFRHFIDGLITGEYKPVSKEEISKMVEEHFFSFQPMIPLDQKQETLLRKLIVDHLEYYLNRDEFKDLCSPIYDNLDRQSGGHPYLLIGEYSQTEARHEGKNLKQLSLMDKLKFFDPQYWSQARSLKDSTDSGLTGYGNRDLKGIGFSDNDWKELLSSVRKSVKKQRLAILDIGCGMGKALDDMKRIDQEVETHGLTLEQEPAMFDADQYYYMAAERMPESFLGKFDLILSNISFRYHLFPHISLGNAILALAKGGHAEIDFSYHGIPYKPPYNEYYKTIIPDAENTYEAVKVKVAELFKKLKTLESEGKIKIITGNSFEARGCQGRLRIDKLDDLKPEEFIKG